MAINSPKSAFTEESIDAEAPKEGGVYGLYDPINITIYYGKSDDDIHKRLISHLNGDEGMCTQRATYFNFEICSNPIEREEQLLQQYKRLHNKLPKCNDLG